MTFKHLYGRHTFDVSLVMKKKIDGNTIRIHKTINLHFPKIYQSGLSLASLAYHS